MTTFETFSSQIYSGKTRQTFKPFDAVGSFIQNVFTRLSEWKRRHEMSSLLKLDDTQLQDMGILRSDVRLALRKPLDVCAGEFLTQVRKRNARAGDTNS